MTRVLVALSLIMSLVLPHMATADMGNHAHPHHDIVSTDNASEPGSDGHHKEAKVMLCCEVLAGHCASVMLQPSAATVSQADQDGETRWSQSTLCVSGLSIAFDPPPPRI